MLPLQSGAVRSPGAADYTAQGNGRDGHLLQGSAQAFEATERLCHCGLDLGMQMSRLQGFLDHPDSHPPNVTVQDRSVVGHWQPSREGIVWVVTGNHVH